MLILFILSKRNLAEDARVRPHPLRGDAPRDPARLQADAPRKQPRELWKWVVLAGLLAVMLEWWVYNMRVQI